RAQQPPPLLPLLRGAGGVEPGADHHAHRLGRAPPLNARGANVAGHDAGVGDGSGRGPPAPGAAPDRGGSSRRAAPVLVAGLRLGDVVVAPLYQTGKFGRHDTTFVWMILVGSTVGMMAVTQGRLLSSAFYALHDTKTPLRFAVVRVCITAAVGWAIALPLRRH